MGAVVPPPAVAPPASPDRDVVRPAATASASEIRAPIGEARLVSPAAAAAGSPDASCVTAVLVSRPSCWAARPRSPRAPCNAPSKSRTPAPSLAPSRVEATSPWRAVSGAVIAAAPGSSRPTAGASPVNVPSPSSRPLTPVLSACTAAAAEEKRTPIGPAESSPSGVCTSSARPPPSSRSCAPSIARSAARPPPPRRSWPIGSRNIPESPPPSSCSEPSPVCSDRPVAPARRRAPPLSSSRLIGAPAALSPGSRDRCSATAPSRSSPPSRAPPPSRSASSRSSRICSAGLCSGAASGATIG